MKIQRTEDGNRGEFFVEENGKNLALMTYSKAGADKIVIEHTEVDESLQGEGIGKDLVAEAVKFARDNDLKIAATCPFARKVLSATAEYQDVFVSK